MKGFNIKKIINITIFLLSFLVLFGFVFTELGIITRTEDFWIEIGIVLGIATISRFNGTIYMEESVETSDEIKDAKKTYDELVDKSIKDIDDLGKFTKEVIDRENKEKFMLKKLKNYTKDNYKRRNIFMPKTFEDFYNKVERKSSKIRKVNPLEVYTRSDSPELVSSKNTTTSKKWVAQMISVFIQTILLVVLAHIAYEEFINSPEALVKFGSYAFGILTGTFFSMWMTYKIVRSGTFNYLSRLETIVKRYNVYKNKKGGGLNGNV